MTRFSLVSLRDVFVGPRHKGRFVQGRQPSSRSRAARRRVTTMKCPFAGTPGARDVAPPGLHAAEAAAALRPHASSPPPPDLVGPGWVERNDSGQY